MDLFRSKKKATSNPSSPPPPDSNVDVMADDDDASSSSSYDQTSPPYPTKSSSSTFVTSGQEKDTMTKPLSAALPSSKLKGSGDRGEGDVSQPSSPKPAEELHDLIRNKYWEEASRRCRIHPQDARRKDDWGWLPMHRACRWRAPLRLIRQLHEAYEEGVKTTGNDGWLPLHYACYGGASLEVITYLVEAYMEGVKTTENKGWLPLHFACRYGASPEVVTCLVDAYGEGVKMTTASGSLPLHQACANDASLEVITYLVEAYGEGVKTTEKEGWLPLHLVCRYCASLEVIAYLHSFYPDGATKRTGRAIFRIFGYTPWDLVRRNGGLSLKEKAAARHILTSPRRAGATLLRPTKHASSAPATAATTLDDISIIPTSTARSATMTKATSCGTTHSRSTPLSQTTLTRPLTSLHEADLGNTVPQRGDDLFDTDGFTRATAAAGTAFSTELREQVDVARATKEDAATGDASRRDDDAIEHVTSTSEVRYTAVADGVPGVGSESPVETETERGQNDVPSFSTRELSERLGDPTELDESAFHLAAERLTAKGFYELHHPWQYDGSGIPPAATHLHSSEQSSHRCHRWEVHCLYDTLLIPQSEVGTVRELNDVGYVAVVNKDGISTKSTGSETDSSGGGKSDGVGDSGGGTWARRVSSAFGRLGFGGDKQDKKKLLLARYNYPYEGRGPATVFVRNERTDHEGKDVMKVKDVDLQTATVADLKREIRLKWHHDATDEDLCLLREDGTELRSGDRTLRDCYVAPGDMILLRQPRVVGKLHVGRQSELREWRQKTSPGRTNPLALHVLKCEGQKDGESYLVDPTCTETFRPHLTINFLPLYTPSNENESQSRLQMKVCTLEFGVRQDEVDGDGMISHSGHRGFFVDRVRLGLKLHGDVRPTRISCPVYTIAPKTYGSRRSRGVAMTARSGERRILDVNGRHIRESSEATTETPVHWRIRADKTPQAWDLSRQTWNAPEEHGGYTLYDVMDPRDIRDFKSKTYSGHNQWLEKKEIPEVTTTYADPIGENDKFMTATWMMDDFQDPFHDTKDEEITINVRQRRATFTVKSVMGLCEIRIVALPGTIRQSYEVVKRYREVVIDQELQFAKISSAPKASSPSPPSRMVVTADVSDSATPAAKTMMEVIRGRRWPEVAKNVLRIDTSECAGLFFLACRLGPSAAVVESFLQVDDDLPQKLNRIHELPVHVLCRNGAERGAIETLVRLYPPSTTMQSRLSKETPLGLAQTRKWIFHEDEQADVISFLRRESFAQHFDGKTGLPGRPGFDLWARIQPPGCTNAKVALLYIDIAGFKAVNDSAGHDEGDRILKNYAQDISRECDVHANLTQSDVFVPYEVYRMGGDEFAVVCKFVGDLRNVWETALEQLASSLSDLNDFDQQNPPRYSTFLRIGCAAGSLSNIDNVLKKADELQTEVQQRIGVVRGEHILLSEIRNQGISNVSELWIF